MAQPDSEKPIKPETGEDIQDLQKELEEARAKAEANLVGWQRCQADFVNFKRFTEQEKADLCKFANAGLLANILPIVDDFERALAALPSGDDHNALIEGLKLIDRKFRDILHKQGVVQIQALGMEFDPRTMDAVTMAKGKKDTVVMELERGYKLQDKVIRPAKVVVGNGEEQVDKEE